MIRLHAGGAFGLALAAAGGGPRAVGIYQRQPDGSWITDAPVTGAVSSSAVSAAGTTAVQATGPVSVIAAGGVGELTVGWSKLSGGTIAADSPASFQTRFSAAGLAPGEARTASFQAVVSDELDGELALGPVEVTIERLNVPTVDVPGSASASGLSASLETADVAGQITGGTAPFQIQWTKRSGGAVLASAPASLTTKFSASNLAEGETRSATFDLIVTDSNGLQASDAIGVSFSRLSALAVSLSTTTLSRTTTLATASTSTVTASPSGGSGPYQHNWQKVAGGAITADTPNSATTDFTATGLDGTGDGETRIAYFKDTVTDALGQVVDSATVAVTIARTAASPTYSPAAGTYSRDGGGSVSYTITASQSVEWTWGGSPSPGLSANVANGGSSSSITFNLSAASSSDRSSTVTVTATAANGTVKSWTLDLTAYAVPTFNPAAGPTSSSANGFVSRTITASKEVTWTWTRTSGAATATVASGASSSSIRFELTGSISDRSSTFTVTATDAGGNQATWTVTLTSYVAATYSPAAGTLSVSGAGSVSRTLAASRAVTWTWSRSGSSAGAASVSSGSSAGSITFSLAGSTADRTCTFTVTATDAGGAQTTWTVTLTSYVAATYSPSAGTLSVSGNGAVSRTITGSRAVTWTWSRSGSSAGTANVSSGSSAGSITFSLAGSSTDRSSTFTVIATDASGAQQSWTVTLTSYVAATYDKAAGSHSTSSTTSPGASFTIAASRAVDWTWSRSGSTAGASSVSDGGSANAITLSLPQGPSDRTCTFSITATDAGGAQRSFSITLNAGAAPPAITFTPVPGSYSEQDDTLVSFTVTASQPVAWVWSRTSGVQGGADIASGSIATSITFTVNMTSSGAGRISSFSLQADGKSWSLELTAIGSGIS